MFKQIIGLVFLCILSANAQSQTKEETEAWIIKQTQVNPYQLKHTIEGDELISHTTI